MIRLAVLALPLMLCGCPAFIGAGAAVGAAGGYLSIANQVARLGNNVLSLDAKIACLNQAFANSRGDAGASMFWGRLCVW